MSEIFHLLDKASTNVSVISLQSSTYIISLYQFFQQLYECLLSLKYHHLGNIIHPLSLSGNTNLSEIFILKFTWNGGHIMI